MNYREQTKMHEARMAGMAREHSRAQATIKVIWAVTTGMWLSLVTAVLVGLFFVLSASVSRGADIGSPVPLPREGSPTFDREVVAKLAEIDDRLRRIEAASQAIQVTRPVSPAPLAAGTRVYSDGLWFTVNADGSWSECVKCNAGVARATHAAPVYQTTYYGRPVRSGPLRRLFGSCSSGGCQ